MENNNRKKYFHDSIPEEERIDAEASAKQVGQALVDKFEEEKAAGKTVGDIMSDNIFNEEKNELEMYNRSTRNDTQLRMHGSEEFNTVMVEFADRQGNVADEIVSSKTPTEVTEREAYYESMVPLTGPTHVGVDQFYDNSSVDEGAVVSPVNQYHSPSSFESSERSDSEMEDASIHNSDSGNESGPIQENESDSEQENESDSEQENVQQILNTNDNTNNDNDNAMEIDQTVATGQDKAEQETSSDSSGQVESKVEESTSSHKRKRDDDSDDDNTGSGPSKRVDIEDYLMDPGSDIFDLSGD